MWTKRTLIVLAVCALMLHSFGVWLQSIYGLAPPYSIFFTGFTLKCIAFRVAIGALSLLMFAFIRAAQRC
jgi:hypothetical protein